MKNMRGITIAQQTTTFGPAGLTLSGCTNRKRCSRGCGENQLMSAFLSGLKAFITQNYFLLSLPNKNKYEGFIFTFGVGGDGGGWVGEICSILF